MHYGHGIKYADLFQENYSIFLVDVLQLQTFIFYVTCGGLETEQRIEDTVH